MQLLAVDLEAVPVVAQRRDCPLRGRCRRFAQEGHEVGVGCRDLAEGCKGRSPHDLGGGAHETGNGIPQSLLQMGLDRRFQRRTCSLGVEDDVAAGDERADLAETEGFEVRAEPVHGDSVPADVDPAEEGDVLAHRPITAHPAPICTLDLVSPSSHPETVGTTASLPDIPYAAWRDTKDTLHLFAQQVGKVKLACTPPQNHWWNATLAVDARGIASGRMRSDGVGFDLGFDLIDHVLIARTDRGDVESFQLRDGLSVASFHEQLFSMLAGLGLDVTIVPTPFGVPMTTPFAADIEHHSYDTDFVHRYWEALSWIDWVFREFGGWFCGKTSRVHLFWHSLDLALTRFSGRRAPVVASLDAVTAEAYSHELISFGFWPGDQSTPQPTFYSYTAPQPEGLTDEPLAGGAQWVDTGNGSLAQLPYDVVREAADPRVALLAFLQSAYEAGTSAAGWSADELRSSWCPPASAFSAQADSERSP